MTLHPVLATARQIAAAMKVFASFSYLLLLAVVTVAHEHHDHSMQMPLDYVRFPYQAVYPGDNEGSSLDLLFDHLHLSMLCAVTANSIFSGISTFAKLPWVQCLGKDKTELFDVAFIGAPFVRTFYVESTCGADDTCRTPAPLTVRELGSDLREFEPVHVV